MSSDNDSGYKPYTTPYTGTGSVKTEEGWISLRDLGAPGAASGPGNRRFSYPPIPSFHHTELTTTNVTPPPDQTNPIKPAIHDSKRTSSLGSRPYPPAIMELINAEMKGIEGPDGAAFDLPEHHQDLSRMSSRDVALKIALLHLVKGNIYEEMQQAAGNPEFLSQPPRDQFRFRREKRRRIHEVLEAIRSWEELENVRAERIPAPSLVDMLMMSHDCRLAGRAGGVSSAVDVEGGGEDEENGGEEGREV